MAAQKFLEELSVQQLLNKYNFIIPEIQREYVWGNNDYNILDKFFTDIKEAIKENTTNEEDAAQIKVLEKINEKLLNMTQTVGQTVDQSVTYQKKHA